MYIFCLTWKLFFKCYTSIRNNYEKLSNNITNMFVYNCIIFSYIFNYWNQFYFLKIADYIKGYSYIYFSVSSQSRFNLYRKIYNKMCFLLDRNDGYYYNAIELPTADPFYLLRYDSHCQRVKGMHVREEIVRFDDEDIGNRNYVSGSYPLGANREDRLLLYCYYWRWL